MFSLLGKISKDNSLFLITTFSPKRDSVIKDLKILPFFEKVVYCRKKTPKLFKKIIKNPKSSVIIGDRKEEELFIGKTLKVKTIKVDCSKESPAITIRKALLI